MKKAELLTTCFGLGNIRIAPGTFGSLPPVIMYQVLAYLWPAANPYVMAFFLLAGSWVCIQYAPALIAATGKKDPQRIVVDEVAGQSVVMLFIALLGRGDICVLTAMGFVLFRLFDILKPWPCKQLEKLPAGLGILADDLMAGVWASAAAGIFIFTKDYFAGAEAYLAPEAAAGGFYAVLLGVAQGLTEFLPVSSSGHLVLLEHFLPSLDPENEEMLLFDLALHVATVGSILIVFRTAIRRFCVSLFSIGQYGGLKPGVLYRKNAAIRFCVLAIVSTVVTAICYKLFKDPLESARKLPVLAVTWAVTAVMLLITDQQTKSRRGLRDIGIGFAIIVGIAQSVAILPGISRSGATICTAILLGLHRRWAIEYSFLISIPAILGGALLQLLKQGEVHLSGGLPASFILIGMISALIAGILSLKWLVRASRKRKLKPFALYCLLLSLFVLFYLL
jgi:undecaprenyl-diphosphatase